MNNVIKFLIIFVVVLIHIAYTNPNEKILINGNKIHTRPNATNRYDNVFSDMGTPSGHMESSIIFLGLLYITFFKDNIKILYIFVVIIILIGLQRIYSKSHNTYQVLIGILMGLTFLFMYSSVSSPYSILLLCIVFYIIIQILSAIKIVRLIDKNAFHPPAWFDKTLYPIIEKKMDYKLSFKLMNTIAMINPIYNPKIISYSSWSDLEKQLDDMWMIVNSDYKPDVIIGIKSGGAILANYLGEKYNIPYDYIKFKRKSNNFIKNAYDRLTEKNGNNLDIVSSPNIDIEGKNVLIVDELMHTGNTLLKTKQYCRANKVTGCKTCVLMHVDYALNNFANKNTSCDYSLMKSVNTMWPWGYDN